MKGKTKFMLALVMVLPLLSVLAVSVMFLLASQSTDLDTLDGSVPLSKTSWQAQP